MCPVSKISNRAEVTRSKRVILGATCPPSLLFDSIQAELWASSYTRAVNSSEATRVAALRYIDRSLLGIKQDGASVDTVFGIGRCSQLQVVGSSFVEPNRIIKARIVLSS